MNKADFQIKVSTGQSREELDAIVKEHNDYSGITSHEKRIIDQRLAAYCKNPEKVSGWKEVYGRITQLTATHRPTLYPEVHKTD